MKTLTVSLSRAHKIAERLKNLWTAALENAQLHSKPIAFTSRPSESTLAETAKAGEALFAAAKLAQRYAIAWATTRNAIAAENNKRGIDQQLTEMEVLRKSKALWASAYKTSIANGHLPSEAASYQPEPSSGRFSLTSFELSVNALRDPSIAPAIKAAHDEHERKWIALQDVISELNVAKVSLVLDDDIADVITGAPLQ